MKTLNLNLLKTLRTLVEVCRLPARAPLIYPWERWGPKESDVIGQEMLASDLNPSIR